MTDPPTLTRATLREGVRALAERDPGLAAIVAAHGPPPLWARPQGFATLVRIVLEQQVSLASAGATWAKLEARLGAVTPAGFLTLDDATLRACGFSRQKTAYVRALAADLESGRLD
ncbi:MAG TPA: hypothetical protein VHG51_09720, partial [Longimicrobiaceae bacterium]|nr:hypothetical protein [Longimicrobiaceae bacterium]